MSNLLFFDSDTPSACGGVVHYPPSQGTVPHQGVVPHQGPVSHQGQPPAIHPDLSREGYPVNDVSSYNYQQDPALYGMNQQNHSILQRYEERLLSKRRQGNQQR
jgi:stress response protein YsnF